MRPVFRVPALFAAVTAVVALAQSQSFPERVGPPASIASLGDSITRAMDTEVNRAGDWPQYSWATGNDAVVGSHFNHLLAFDQPVAPVAYNDAVSGAKVADLVTQVNNAIAQDAGYVTILIGANDACAASEAEMTPVATYQAEIETQLDRLSVALPDTRIFIASVPNVYLLWDSLHTDWGALLVWGAVGICQSLLADPLNLATSAETRRQNVRQRVADYNAALAAACSKHLLCRFDDNAVFSTQFTGTEVSDLDFFHPSQSGQDKLAQGTWSKTYDFSDTVAPVSRAEATWEGDLATLSLTATDDAGVRGIQYRLPTDDRWANYSAPMEVGLDASVIYRAVDMNGNLEAGKTFTNDGPPPGACGCGAGAGAPLVVLALGWALRKRRLTS